MMNYQEQAQLNAELSPVKSPVFATVGAVYPDGVTLIFDGETAETTKRYRVNTTNSYAPGDRVKLLKISGTYIVEYVVGKTGSGSGNPYNNALIVCPFRGNLNNIKNNGYTINKNTGDDPIYYPESALGQCLQLTNKCQLVVSSNLIDKMNAPFTVSMWLWYSNTGLSPYYGYRRALWATYAGAYFPMPEISYSSSTVSTNKIKLNTAVSANVYNNAWHWICITRTAYGFMMYIDKSAEILLNASGLTNLFSTSLYINDSSYALNGYMTHLCFWDRVLTDIEMDYLWNDGAGNFAA
jgi:hypothetical protein